MRLRRIRPSYWGLVLTIAGICSSTILQLITSCEHMPLPFKPIIFNTMRYFCRYGPISTFHIALTCIAHVVMFFSLPFATAIEARRSLKGRKSEAKEREDR